MFANRFIPSVESFEERVNLSALPSAGGLALQSLGAPAHSGYAGSHALYQDLVIPAASSRSDATGRVTGIAADPTNSRYSAIVFVGGWGSSAPQAGHGNETITVDLNRTERPAVQSIHMTATRL